MSEAAFSFTTLETSSWDIERLKALTGKQGRNFYLLGAAADAQAPYGNWWLQMRSADCRPNSAHLTSSGILLGSVELKPNTVDAKSSVLPNLPEIVAQLGIAASKWVTEGCTAAGLLIDGVLLDVQTDPGWRANNTLHGTYSLAPQPPTKG